MMNYSVDVSQTLFLENQVLGQMLASVQDRCTRLLAEKMAEIQALQSKLQQQRTKLMVQETQIAFLRGDL